MSKTAAQIRQEFIDFFCAKHGHTFVPGASVIPYDDPTLLFTNAGMNQFKPLFLGTADRGSEFGRMKRAANSQPCIRAGGKHNDLDDVGHDTYHHTLFEMLGNWSFGDYFKKEAIEWAWELVTKVWGIDASRLHATYFGGDVKEGLEPDLEARDLWRSVPGMSADRVHPGNKKDNFWEMGDTGPCGPCSEIHIDLTPDKSGGRLVNAGDERVIEFWNLVFIQFNRGADGKLVSLPAKHVDTGMGFERIARIIQGKRSNYDIDVFTPIFAAIQRVSGAAPYGGRMEHDVEQPPTAAASDREGSVSGERRVGTAHRSAAPPSEAVVGDAHPTDAKTQPRAAEPHLLMADVAYRVIADHIRTLVFAISDGCPPDKDGRGFVLRRILRRAVRYGWQYLGLRKPFLFELVPTVIDVMGEAFPRLKGQAGAGVSPARSGPAGMDPARVASIIREEEESFARTLDRGIALFEEAAQRAQRDHKGEVQGDDAFKLHDTYGFPIDLTQIMANERKLRVDIGEFERLMEDAREKARGKSKSQAQDDAFSRLAPGECDDSPKYDEWRECHAVISSIARATAIGETNTAKNGESIVFSTDRTCFYAEQGGQVSDKGLVKTKTGTIRVDSVDRHTMTMELSEGPRSVTFFPHSGVVIDGEIGYASECVMSVRPERRIPTMQNHTATHILNWSLREVLDPSGQQLQQKGSLVDPDKTRFDFSHSKAVEPAEIERIESLVADQIARNLPVETNNNEPVSQKDAMKINGLRAVFGEKYPDQVRVVSIGVPVADLLQNPDNPEWRKYSIEFCGGTHVKSTADIEKFAIISEEAVAKGIRRIVGVTGQKARDAIDAGVRLLDEIAQLRTAPPPRLAQALPQLLKALESATLRVVDRAKLRDAVAELQARVKQEQKAVASQSTGEIMGKVADLLAAATKIGNTTIVVAELPDAPIDALKTAADAIKQKSGSAAIFFGVAGERATLLAAVTDDLIKKGVKAGDWVKAIAPIVDGGGGGPPTMAQAGGKNPAKLGEALAAAREWVAEKL